jgi:uncharacterized protein
MSNIEEIAKIANPVLQKYGVASAGVFGSHARGEARQDSDIDLIVSFGEKPISLWDMIALRDDLSKLLNKVVDVISDKAIVPYFKDTIYHDLKPIYP